MITFEITNHHIHLRGREFEKRFNLESKPVNAYNNKLESINISLMCESLTLYTRPRCAYCDLVRDVISEIGINVEERNIWEKEQWRDEILAAQGKDTVPILRRDSTNGNIYWLPESDAIVRYLLQNYS